MGAKPDQMRIEPRQFTQQHTQPLRPLWDFQLQQFFNRQAVAEIVMHRAEVIDAVSERHHLLIKLCLAGLLDAGVQKADVRCDANHHFAVNFQHQTQNTVRGRMLRAHVQNHGAVFAGVDDGGSGEQVSH